MAYSVTREDILGIEAQGAVLPLEMTGRPTEGRAAQRLAAAGGVPLRRGLRRLGFLAVGSAARVELWEPGAAAGGSPSAADGSEETEGRAKAAAPGSASAGEALPFQALIATAVPRWLTGKANELLALERCYESVFRLAEELGLKSLALPFLSSCYYRFPLDEAVHIALEAAGRFDGRAVFAADSDELLALSEQRYRRPQIVAYVGWYHDLAVFQLDNGLYARVDLRPELRRVDTVPYIEACYRVGTDPKQVPLPEREILRLRRIWEEAGE